jgi:hypothetical protein
MSKTLDKDLVQKSNIQLAQKFGLAVDDITSAEVVTSDKNTVNDYGKVLALLSQMELSNNKTTSEVAESIKKSFNRQATELDNLLNGVKNDTTVDIKNISKNELQGFADSATDGTEPKRTSSGDVAVTNRDGSKIFVHFDL